MLPEEEVEILTNGIAQLAADMGIFKGKTIFSTSQALVLLEMIRREALKDKNA